ncbi:MAG: bifunctional folylpolyglutamate synthase/dihydrofolate synthase [Thermoplasmatota archaeon]
MDSPDAMAWLDSLARFGMRMRLEAIEALLASLGDPQKDLRAIHVGGTNGKGSVAALAASAFSASGRRTGLYTSPHLVHFAERVRVDGAKISERDIAAGLTEIRPAVERLEPSFGPLTYFEVSTALAFLHFERARVQCAVVEVGLGGRLDATNVLADPLATVLTNVALDHTEVLGADIVSIAREKAAIVKPGVPVVTGCEGDALAVVRGAAEANVAPLRVLGDDFSARSMGHDRDGQTLRFTGVPFSADVRIPLVGAHQVGNAALAAAALAACAESGFAVSEGAFERGFRAAHWPARLQWIPGAPPLLVDGAHNPAGAAALASYLDAEKLRPTLVFGCMTDKDWLDMVTALAPYLAGAVVTRPRSPRALPPMESGREFSRVGVTATMVPDVKHALATAVNQAGPDGVVLVAGSLYLAGEVLEVLGRAP